MRVGDGCNPTGVKSQPGSTDVCMKTSDDNGATWSALKIVAEGASQPTAVFDSVQEAIVLQFNAASGHNAQTVSSDLGATWSDPSPVDTSFGNASATSVGPGRGIQLSPDNKKVTIA